MVTGWAAYEAPPLAEELMTSGGYQGGRLSLPLKYDHAPVGSPMPMHQKTGGLKKQGMNLEGGVVGEGLGAGVGNRE